MLRGISHKQWIVAALFGGALFAVGLFAGVLLSSTNDVCSSSYTFINPEPDCETFDSKAQATTDLQNKLEAQIQSITTSDHVTDVGVFVRDLTTKRFAGVNDNTTFHLASLLKVPLLIAYYKLAEVEPRILDETTVYSGTPNLYAEQKIKPRVQLKIGSSYTTNDLLYAAIAYSDNTAAQILANRLPDGFLDRVRGVLGIRYESNGADTDLITPKTYAGIFRILYNASYLSRDYSNKALELLSQSTYTDGAVSGLPQGTTVSHKFGEREVVDPVSHTVMVRQLHDCGIVYPAGHDEPYSFCIMTQGDDTALMQAAIQDISRTIYSTLIQ